MSQLCLDFSREQRALTGAQFQHWTKFANRSHRQTPPGLEGRLFFFFFPCATKLIQLEIRRPKGTPAIISSKAESPHSQSTELPRVCTRGGACPMPKSKTERKNIGKHQLVAKIPNKPWRYKSSYPSTKQKVNLCVSVNHLLLKTVLSFQALGVALYKA